MSSISLASLFSNSNGVERPPQKFQKLLTDVLRDFPAAIVVADLDSQRIVAESDKALESLQCSSYRTGQPLKFQWANGSEFKKYINEVRAEDCFKQYEVMLQRNSGSQFWSEVSSRTIDLNGRQFLIIHFSDLTEQITVREELARKRDALHDAEKLSSLGELLGSISHELNNPLSALTGQAFMLLEKTQDSEIQNRARRILNTADRCSKIVRSFLDLAKGNPSDPVAVCLSDIVGEAVEICSVELRRSGIEVVLQIPSTLPRILADYEQIRQVVINLLQNAEHALRSNNGPKRISIIGKYLESEGVVSLTVSDTGHGVPDGFATRIFEPLFSTKAPGEGTGFGLSLCRRIMEAHSGSIRLISTSYRGSAFGLEFKCLENGPVDPQQVVRRVGAVGQGYPILVVDDHVVAGRSLTDRIAQKGHDVTLVRSPFVGINLVRRSRFDAIFYRIGLGAGSVAESASAFEKARQGSLHSLIFLGNSSSNKLQLEQVDWVERPYLVEPFCDQQLGEALDLTVLRSAA